MDGEIVVANAIRQALLAKDQNGLEALMVRLAFHAPAREVEELAQRLMDEMPHDVQAWWGAPCDICPNPN